MRRRKIEQYKTYGTICKVICAEGILASMMLVTGLDSEQWLLVLMLFACSFLVSLASGALSYEFKCKVQELEEEEMEEMYEATQIAC